jgi:hypothetical protein
MCASKQFASEITAAPGTNNPETELLKRQLVPQLIQLESADMPVCGF